MTERCQESVFGKQCEREVGHDGPCSRQEVENEARFGQ